jgi:deazaflavin-dependent oxidoreductase (nitroreductase family)
MIAVATIGSTIITRPECRVTTNGGICELRQKTPGGTRGAWTPSLPKPLLRFLTRRMISSHRRKRDTFQGMDILYLTTVGARSGEQRQTPLARFPDGEQGWLIVGSAAGAARHPAWYHNLAADPDQVWIDVRGRRLRVTPEQLDGERRAQAWQRIVTGQSRYAGYQDKTDRVLPVIRLSPAT